MHIIDDIINNWGPSKTAQFVLASLIGASIFGLAVATLIPDDPSYIETSKGEE